MKVICGIVPTPATSAFERWPNVSLHQCSRCNLQVVVHDYLPELELVCTLCWEMGSGEVGVASLDRCIAHQRGETDAEIAAFLDRSLRHLKARYN